MNTDVKDTATVHNLRPQLDADQGESRWPADDQQPEGEAPIKFPLDRLAD